MTQNDDDSPTTIVSFRVFSPDLDPNEVTQVLQMNPDSMHQKGDYPRGDPKYSPYKHGMWTLESKIAKEEPLIVLEPQREGLQELSQHHIVDFYCSLFWQNGYDLPAQLVKRMAGIGAGIGVSVYPL